ncbi:CPBP family intramembrane glutamic endopeptidase [Algoriphagus antarcticus]|uniref:CAAX prenyl protease 2/Lysostaphin resistance protein A-like domain-containing protein n=1 Tax=Algoriphagus antarcticus TaxID=238540 RepID=A0A3E0DK83_9BACT|nr:CPBP family intramembrane glutamic endopeptidase [Algoriphagus antarcticus]REG82479.1 hypothetical protein C8N25_1218 [Algoriphagus antarcticus]
MLGIVIILAVSWILLYLIEKKSILALGFLPILKRLTQFAGGFLFTAVLCVGIQTLEILLQSSEWHLNGGFSAYQFFDSLRWDFISVLTEELVFRGALLVILINRLGAGKAILISAIAFGIYHWFSFGIFGNVVPMFFVFIGTGFMGYAWALAFAKTNSIFIALGLHLGWNFTFNTIFSHGPLGEGLLISTGGNAISDWFSLVGLWLVPVIVFLVVKYFVPSESREIRQEKVKTTADIL